MESANKSKTKSKSIEARDDVSNWQPSELTERIKHFDTVISDEFSTTDMN